MPVHNYSFLRRGLSVVRALGNAKRVATVFLLDDQEMTVKELAHFHYISRPAMSRHLHILLKEGIIESERRYGEVYFWLSPKFRKVWNTLKKVLWDDVRM